LTAAGFGRGFPALADLEAVREHREPASKLAERVAPPGAPSKSSGLDEWAW